MCLKGDEMCTSKEWKTARNSDLLWKWDEASETNINKHENKIKQEALQQEQTRVPVSNSIWVGVRRDIDVGTANLFGE